MKLGALGFTGTGQISYQGDVMRIKGNRRNSNLGMSRLEVSLPTKAIARSMVDGTEIEFFAGRLYEPLRAICAERRTVALSINAVRKIA